MSKNILRTIGVASYIVGILIFFYISILSTWAEIEATFFNALFKSDDPLPGLSCPAFITPNETAIVSGTFENTFNKTINMEIQTYVTDGYVTLMNEFISNFTLEPGQTEVIEIPVFAKNAAFDRFVMVRMHQLKRSPFPYQNAACGIVVVNFPYLKGTQFVILMIALAVILSVGGIVFWALNAQPVVWDRLKGLQAMIILLCLSIVLTTTSLMNSWLLSVIFIVIWILMAVGMVWQFSLTERKLSFEEIRELDEMDRFE